MVQRQRAVCVVARLQYIKANPADVSPSIFPLLLGLLVIAASLASFSRYRH
jgi:hypothetical protein